MWEVTILVEGGLSLYSTRPPSRGEGLVRCDGMDGKYGENIAFKHDCNIEK